jgi:hypothetical protein
MQNRANFKTFFLAKIFLLIISQVQNFFIGNLLMNENIHK